MSAVVGALRIVAPRAAGYADRWEQSADRYWHRSSAALGCLLTAQLCGWGFGRQVAALVLGALFGGGILSPDTDQYGWWRRLDRWLPDEALGKGGPLMHHGITHWPGLPIAGLAVLYAGDLLALWPVVVICWAWLWHDAGDILIGRGGPDVRAGVPLVLWWGHIGLGRFRSGGLLAKALTVVCGFAGPVLLIAGATS